MRAETFETSSTRQQVQVRLDGLPIQVPAERRSLVAIRSYVETLAMEHQRIVCAFSVDGERASLGQPLVNRKTFSRVDAKTIELDQMPLQFLEAALHQAGHARERVASAVTLVLVNDACVAREFWWSLTCELKAPLLTLSLLPDDICGPANGRASLTQLRKWQLQQLANIIREVDGACHSENTLPLSNALENRVLPWLQSLHEHISLWHETIAAGARFAAECAS
ncbi:MAG TPA: hypothetical protein VFR76_09460 [Verrucomicrobiae bacterium]|nr:hypothetical protein [Verrucomicrobiae bacterium]